MFPDRETGRIARGLCALLLLALLLGCANALHWEGEARGSGTYTVKEGDTLYSIAFRHGLDYRELAEWNEIGSGFLIYPGDELTLGPAGARRTGSGTAASGGASSGGRSERASTEPRASSATGRESRPGGVPQRRSDLSWVWPLEGELLSRFGDGAMGRGIQIGAAEGTPVKAAAPGRVVYTGSGLIGYGKLIIIKHDDVFLSAYGHNQEILVDEGDEVKAGDRIARVGLGRGNRSMLHFEIRSEGNAVDPVPFLPGRG